MTQQSHSLGWTQLIALNPAQNHGRHLGLSFSHTLYVSHQATVLALPSKYIQHPYYGLTLKTKITRGPLEKWQKKSDKPRHHVPGSKEVIKAYWSPRTQEPTQRAPTDLR